MTKEEEFTAIATNRGWKQLMRWVRFACITWAIAGIIVAVYWGLLAKGCIEAAIPKPYACSPLQQGNDPTKPMMGLRCGDHEVLQLVIGSNSPQSWVRTGCASDWRSLGDFK